MAVEQPKWGTRGSGPGGRGCWAVTKRGLPCEATKRKDSDYCSAHAGYGIAADPLAHSLRGRQASAETRARRAALRLALGSSRLDSPRGALRAAAWIDAERIAARTISALLDPSLSPEATVRAALQVLDAVDPVATADISFELDPSTISSLSLDEALAAAERLGLQQSQAELPSGEAEHQAS